MSARGGVLGRMSVADADGFTSLDLLEIEGDIVVLTLTDLVGHVDLGVVGELALRFQTASLITRVLENDVGLRVLEVAKTNQNDVALQNERKSNSTTQTCKPISAPQRATISRCGRNMTETARDSARHSSTEAARVSAAVEKQRNRSSRRRVLHPLAFAACVSVLFYFVAPG